MPDSYLTAMSPRAHAGMSFFDDDAVFEVTYIEDDAPDDLVSHIASTLAWFEKARRWHAISVLIWQEFIAPRDPEAGHDTRMIDEWAFAQGTAVEITAKAVRFAKVERTREATERALSDALGHKLVPLVRGAGVEPNKMQRDALRYLTEAIVTRGRYPAARTLSQTPRYTGLWSDRLEELSTEVLRALDAKWRQDVKEGPWAEWVFLKNEARDE